MNRLDYHYLWLLRKIKEDGVRKEGRNGWTRSIFGYQIRHHMDEGFPLLTTKKMWFKGIRTELEWFLNGDTNIQPLVKKGNNIWVGDAFKRYYQQSHEFKGNWPDTEEEFIERIKNDDEFAEKWGDMGPIYGKQWRKWGRNDYPEYDKYNRDNEGIDQIQNLIDALRNNPDSRRMMVNAWNVGEIDDMVLPPCHYGFQVWTRELTDEEKDYYETDYDRGISLMFNMRSVDLGLGFPFNIASYGLLLLMIADEVLMHPLELVFNGGDVHVYENQWDGLDKQLERDSYELPTVHVRDGIWSRGSGDIILKNYKHHPPIKLPLSN